MNRKWTLARWSMVLATCVIASGIVGYFIGKEGAAGIIMQGLGGVAGVLSIYGAVNVTQKSVEKKE